ncbi:hypothetical protein [Deinococcus hopiensis]|uniref:Uncharacterized protein n=1 Tax=Deinococcus hopiensis KR-140 TaxID=695939 RepID=A0A1W1VSC7_9DEIO|nr:hypothetical protein [Deinococcus hopiensis]SMB96249.1 hypothetical protein SAMN00790413_03220 [Deinococcus hopiensis KR-140]
MHNLNLEELVAYFFHAQEGLEQGYQPVDFVRLIEDLGLESANALRHEIVGQLAGGRRLQVIQAELAA